MKINFKKKVVTTPLRKAKGRLNKTLISADQTEKVMLLKSIVTSQSPGTKNINELTNTPCSSGSSSASQTSTHDVNIYKTYQQLKKKRDKMSNCVKRALLKSVDVNFPESKIRKFGASYKAFKLAKNVTFEEKIYHYKVNNKRPKVIHQAVKDCIIAFYSLGHISRLVPYRNKTIEVKDAIGNHIRISIRMMEFTLHKTYLAFCDAYPDIRIDKRSFEKLRPKYVRLKRCAQRLVCACSYHLNIDYLRSSICKLLKVNEIDVDLSTNEKLCKYLLCDVNNIKCIIGHLRL